MNSHPLMAVLSLQIVILLLPNPVTYFNLVLCIHTIIICRGRHNSWTCVFGSQIQTEQKDASHRFKLTKVPLQMSKVFLTLHYTTKPITCTLIPITTWPSLSKHFKRPPIFKRMIQRSASSSSIEPPGIRHKTSSPRPHLWSAAQTTTSPTSVLFKQH